MCQQIFGAAKRVVQHLANFTVNQVLGSRRDIAFTLVQINLSNRCKVNNMLNAC